MWSILPIGVSNTGSIVHLKQPPQVQREEPPWIQCDLEHIFLPQVDFARRRLAGDHPAELMIGELAARHRRKPHWAALQVSRTLGATIPTPSNFSPL